MASFADARERLTGPPRQLRWLAAVAASLAVHAAAWTLLGLLASMRPPAQTPIVIEVVPVTPGASPAGVNEGAAAHRAAEEAASARAARGVRQAEARRRADEARRVEDARLAAEVRHLAEARQAEELRHLEAARRAEAARQTEAVRRAAEAAAPAKAEQAARESGAASPGTPASSAPPSHSATGPQRPAAPEGGASSPGSAARLEPDGSTSGAAASGHGDGGYEPLRPSDGLLRPGYEPPRLVARSAVEPQYPPSAYRLGVEGIALVGVAVKPDGTVAESTLVRSAGDPDLDRAALEAVRRWLFEPARRDGAPVAGTVQVPVRFELR